MECSRKPSGQWGLHAIFYRNKPNVRAVAHTHSVCCTVLAALVQLGYCQHNKETERRSVFFMPGSGDAACAR